MFRGSRRLVHQAPTLSAVVPVYDVEEFLPACLASIAAQDFTDYEVIIVDDGSPDDSAKIAASHAEEDPRIRVVSQANAGLGAARNVGVEHARGELLTFVDGDDELAPRAWSRMVETLQRTGSDLVAGKAVRDNGSRRWAMPRMKANHAADRLSVTVEEMPGILADVFAWNKVYRRDFWVGNGLEFPQDVRYEDQPALTRALLATRAFDVLSDTVYYWRVRADGTSITQRRHELKDLEDRILTKRDSAEQVRAYGVPGIRRTFHAEVLPVDMGAYFRAVPDCSEQYWRLLVDAVNEFWNDATVPFENTLLPMRVRLMGWFVARGRRNDLLALLHFIDAHAGAMPREHGRPVHPWRNEPGLPDSLM